MIAAAVLALAAADPLPPPPPPRAAPPPYVKPERPEPTPLSHRGFQMAVRSGVALPAGKASEGTAMADLVGWQIPLFAELGAKVSRHVFIGGYASFSLGSVTDRFERDQCGRRDCAARAAHLGAEIQYHAAPAHEANPWFGVGVGYEWLWTSGQRDVTLRGPELARLMAGVDLRLSRSLGLGPVVDATLARYHDDDLGEGRLHSWVTVGLRLVVFP